MLQWWGETVRKAWRGFEGVPVLEFGDGGVRVVGESVL